MRRIRRNGKNDKRIFGLTARRTKKLNITSLNRRGGAQL